MLPPARAAAAAAAAWVVLLTAAAPLLCPGSQTVLGHHTTSTPEAAQVHHETKGLLSATPVTLLASVFGCCILIYMQASAWVAALQRQVLSKLTFGTQCK